MRVRFLSASLLAVALAFPALSYDDDDKPCAQGTCKSSWSGTGAAEQKPATDLGKDYKSFLNVARTELLTVAYAIEEAKKNGFKEWKAGTKINPGDRYYDNNRDRALTLIIGGQDPVASGVRFVASHIDSPRLELKGRPNYGKAGFGLFQTNYHGGIKTYQWTNLPLALLGRVDKKDGTTVQISIGLDPSDPIFMIPDLSPHVDRPQRNRKAREVIAFEELDPIVASGPHGPEGKIDASTWVFRYLKANYGIEAADLVSAELALVPATPPRDMGFDRRLTAAYGQDDRLSAFASIQAAMALTTPPKTTIILLADNEESGNNNVTGASSTYLVDLTGELLYAEVGDAYRQPLLTRALRASKALSIDVNPGINPMNPGVWEGGNAPKLGYGINIKLYGKGFNANSEFIAWTRAALDDAGVPWQTATYKVARGGGGTLGGELSHYNIDTIDFGVPVLSIHTPYAVSDKMDVLALKNGIKAFIEKK
ncbi:MAG: peptidase M18 [Kordiimonadales bacterium]|nr:MAG: peptidase M18 [Kordiimonadales bacterium]